MGESEADRLIGQTVVQNYELIAVVDTGGETPVYKVKDKRDSLQKALKLIHPISDEKLPAFHEMCRKVKGEIKHPRLAQLHDFGVFDDFPGIGKCAYMVFDFLPGRSLHSILNKQGRIELDEALPLFIQISELCKHLHAAGFSNLQLSPRKIIINEQSDKKVANIADPGVSAQLCMLSLEPADLGTPFPEDVLYLSPEQCSEQNQDHRSDIYALGCIMYECLIGLPPFLSKSAYEVSRMHLNEEAKPLRMSRDDLNFPLELDLLVLKALRKNPSQRQQNMGELLEDLEHVKAEISKVPDLELAGQSKRPASFFSNLLEDLSDLFGIDDSLKIKLAIPVVLGLILIFGSVGIGFMLNSFGSRGQEATSPAEREWQQLDNQAQKDFDRGNLSSAEDRYLKALPIAEKLGDRPLLTTLKKLQDVYYSQKRFDKADELETRIKDLMAANSQ